MSKTKDTVYEIEDGELIDIALGDGATELILPEEVEEINFSTFQYPGLEQIVTVQLPEHLEHLESGVFHAGFQGLETIRLGSHIRKIDKGAVSVKCKALKTVEIEAKQSEVKLSPFAFPNTAEIVWRSGEAPSAAKAAEPEKEPGRELPLAEAKKRYAVSKRKDGYSITDFSKDPRIRVSGILYRFGKNETDRMICIPERIDGVPVVYAAEKTIPEDAVVCCSAAQFAKLSRLKKAETACAFLLGAEGLWADEIEAIRKFIKSYGDEVAQKLARSGNAAAFSRFFDLAKPKSAVLQQLLETPELDPESKALILDRIGASAPKKQTSDPERAPMSATALKKLWSVRALTNGDTGEEFAELNAYKGTAERVVVPAFVGKLPVKRFCCEMPDFIKSVEFEREDIDLQGSFQSCRSLADPMGFIILQVGSRRVLYNYVGNRRAETLSIPAGVTETKFGALKGVLARKVQFPVGFERLAGGTLMDCKNLQQVELPEGLKEIGALAFSGCDCLKELYIPASVETIGAFGRKDSPTIYGEPGTAAQAFAEAGHLTFVPGRIAVKEADDFIVENGILKKYLGNEAEPVLPQGIREIGSKAFSNGRFSALRFPEGLETVQNLSCQNCGSLQTVEFPASLRSIGSFCFSMCHCLKEAKLPEGLLSIGMHAFSHCGALTDVYLPASLSDIGNDAFASCSRLTFHAPAGSFAEQYAKEHDIPFAAE